MEKLQNHEKTIDIEVYEHRVKDKDDLIILEREQKEYWKDKYYRNKEKLVKIEAENKTLKDKITQLEAELGKTSNL